jgi:hypothetical protein
MALPLPEMGPSLLLLKEESSSPPLLGRHETHGWADVLSLGQGNRDLARRGGKIIQLTGLERGSELVPHPQGPEGCGYTGQPEVFARMCAGSTSGIAVYTSFLAGLFATTKNCHMLQFRQL